jgi:hypothetical protein
MLCAQEAAPPSTQNESAVAEEYLLLGDPNRGAGEPWVAVNPKNPDNIVVTAMATLNRLPSGEAPVRTDSPDFTALRIKELSVPDGSITDIAVTHDGGRTWVFATDDFRRSFGTNRCSDSFAGAGTDGSLYIGCLALLARGSADLDQTLPWGEPYAPRGGSAIARSTDGGRTWSTPVWVHPLRSPQLYPPAIHPAFVDVSPADRPLFAEDAANGTIFLSGTGWLYTGDHKAMSPTTPQYPSESEVRWSGFIRASHDQGKTWGPIYPVSSDRYPQAGERFGLSAAHGYLLVGYRGGTAAGERCPPCILFGVSRDDGRSFDYGVLPYTPAAPTPPETNDEAPLRGALVAADPSTAGRFAIAYPSGQKLVVTISDDHGEHWRPPVTVTELSSGVRFGHGAMKFSPGGVLALMWKSLYPDGTFDTWSAASLDHGNVFHIVRISHARSPAAPADRDNFMMGDDLSSIDVDGQFIYVVWGDNRAGFRGTWFGRVPLRAYRAPKPAASIRETNHRHDVASIGQRIQS